jgi:hypothetical protein
MKNLTCTFIAILCLTVLPQVQAKPLKPQQAQKEPLVLMPLRLAESEQSLQGAMETALIEGLAKKYKVYSGEQVAKKAREIFAKESKNTAHKECDETRCLQGIAESFQSELLAVANVTKQEGGYFLALSIRNLFDNQDVYSKSLPCKGCDAFQVVEKLKELVEVPTNTPEPVVEELQAKVDLTDPETALWEEAKKGNSAEDYQAYLKQYPKGKYIALAKTKLARMKDEAKAESEKQEQQSWNDAQQSGSQDSYNAYLSLYPKGHFAALAQARIAKLKKELSDAETNQRREQLAEEAKQKREQTKIVKDAKIEKAHISTFTEYSRIILESVGEIHCQTMQIKNPDRLIVDIVSPEAVTESNISKLQKLNDQISSNDIFLKAIRVGVFKSGVIRMVIDLKMDVKQEVRILKPKAGNGYQLVLDVYSVNAEKPAI